MRSPPVRRALPLLCLALLSACPASKTPQPNAKERRWPACDPAATTQKISFVHINDMHSNYQLNAQGVSPYALVRAYYLKVKQENPYTIFTSGGDEYEKGAVAEQMSHGLTTRLALWGMQFDVRVIGNHDFAWSEEEVLEEARDPWSEVLSSSVTYTGNDPRGFAAKEFVALQVGCVKTGFFGLTAWSYDDRNLPRMEEPFYPNMPTNLDFLGVTAAQVAAHRSEVDLLIPINHIGDVSDYASALSVGGMDAILGGHSHTLMQTIDPASTNGVAVIQADAYASYVSRLDLTWDLKQKKVTDATYVVTPVNAEALGVQPDPAVQQIVEDAIHTHAPDSQLMIAHAKTSLPDHHAVSSLLARAALQQLHADAAVMDDDTVWGQLSAGPVTPQDLYNCYKVERQPPGSPGFNAVYTVSISGAALRNLATSSREGWVTVAPDTIDDSRTYVLAGQKRTLNHPSEYLPPGVQLIGTPVAVEEAWETLYSYGKDREAQCQFVDADEAISGCTPR